MTPYLVLAHSAVLAGIRIRSNRSLTGLPANGESDLALEVLFAPTGRSSNRAVQAAVDRFVPPDRAYLLPGSTALTGRIAADGRRAVMVEPPSGTMDVARSIRSVLPFASALQGGVILHGSAVAVPDGIHVFIGASGAGKSTLAAHLAALGLPQVADDLTPCRPMGDHIAVPLPSEATGKVTHARLRSVHFLTRSADIDRVNCVAITPAQCVARLLWNGFSELAAKELWALQFNCYSRIARIVPGFDLVVPEDRLRIGAIAADVRVALTDPSNVPGAD